MTRYGNSDGAPCAVIMAGGAGERFWPYSRRLRPKQLLRFGEGAPMLREAVDRAATLMPVERVLIVAGGHLRGPILEVLGPDFPPGNLVIEPEARNTAPCLALAAAVAGRRFGNVPMAVLTADHVICPTEVFLGQVAEACELAGRTGALLTFGIAPTEPHTGFGYIECGKARPDLGADVFEVKQFREKPDLETAKGFLAAGTFFWNSGMFFWTVDALREAFRTHQPVMFAALEEIGSAWDGPDQETTLARAFGRMEKLAFDVAVLERATHRLTLRARFEWEDIGSWTALDRVRAPDGAGNVVLGDVVSLDARGCTFFASPDLDPPPLIAALGVEDLVVVVADGVVLVAHRSRAQEVKALLSAAREKRPDLL